MNKRQTAKDAIEADEGYPHLIAAIRQHQPLKAVAYAREIGHRTEISASTVYDIARQGAMTTWIVMATEQGAQHASTDNRVTTLCGIRIGPTWFFEHQSATRGMSLRQWAGEGDSCVRCLKKEDKS